jgi:protein LSM14
VPDEDYNFEEANKHFDKEAALREAENVVKAKQAAYNKDDFFDMMSCETLDKMGHAQAPDGMHNRRSMQRAVDIETFGGLGGVRHFHHRGRGRGRGGGRGGYGRQGGGFYNNPQGGGRGPRQ